MTKNTFIFIIIIGIIFGGGAYYYYTLEEKERDIYVGFRGEARKNPFLAAIEFLKTFEITSRAVDITEIEQLDGQFDTLIIPSERYTLTKSNSILIKNWIEAGGHLITVARDKDSEDGKNIRPDYLLDPFEIYLHDVEEDNFKRLNSGELLDIETFEDQRLSFSNSKPQILLLDEYGEFAYQIPYANGKITVFADLSFIKNRSIDEKDHAELFRKALFFNHEPKEVFFVIRETATGFMTWMWNQAWQFLIAVLLFIIVSLVYASQRLGPVLQNVPQTRRRITEHIDASARFFWKYRMSETLLNANRKSLLRYIHRNHPSIDTHSWDSLAKFLAETGVASEKDIQWALQLKSTSNHNEFLKVIQLYERIRKTI